MSSREIFIKAHAITRESVARFGGDYRVTFGAALSYLYAKEKRMDKAKLLKIGGREWKTDAHHRIYLNDLDRWLGLEYSTYKTGNISSAAFQGKGISNSEAKRILSGLVASKFYFDVKKDRFFCENLLTEHGLYIKSRVLEACQSA